MRRRAAVDALGRFRKALAAAFRQPILAEFAGAARLYLTIERQARGGSAHQPFIETERHGQANQAAQGDCTAARHDGIAEYRDDEGSTAQGSLAAKAREQLVRGSGGVGVHFPVIVIWRAI